MKRCLVYMTTNNVSEARKVGRAILRARLAACVNIVGPIESMYWWKEAILNSKEVLLIAKTTARNLDALIQKVLSIHSYDVPCVVAWAIEKGNPEFLRWIDKETQSLRRPSTPARIR